MQIIRKLIFLLFVIFPTFIPAMKPAMPFLPDQKNSTDLDSVIAGMKKIKPLVKPEEYFSFLQNAANALVLSQKLQETLDLSQELIPQMCSTSHYGIVDGKVIFRNIPSHSLLHWNGEICDSSMGKLFKIDSNTYSFIIESLQARALSARILNFGKKYIGKTPEEEYNASKKFFSHFYTTKDPEIKKLTGNLIFVLSYRLFINLAAQCKSIEEIELLSDTLGTFLTTLPPKESNDSKLKLFVHSLTNSLASQETLTIANNMFYIFTLAKESYFQHQTYIQALTSTITTLNKHIIELNKNKERQEILFQAIITELESSIDSHVSSLSIKPKDTKRRKKRNKGKKKQGNIGTIKANKAKHLKKTYLSFLPTTKEALECKETELPSYLWSVRYGNDARLLVEKLQTKKINKQKAPNKPTNAILQQAPAFDKTSSLAKASADRSADKLTDKMSDMSDMTLEKTIDTITYDPRITRWFDNDFIKNQSQKNILYHGFSYLIDKFIIELGQHRKRRNKNKKTYDDHYHVPGEIEYTENGKTVTKFVVFTHCQDSNGICYHRGFEEKEWNELFAENKETHFYNTQYPTLESAEQFTHQQKNISQETDEFGSRIMDNNNLYIQFYDSRLQARFTIYKVNS